MNEITKQYAAPAAGCAAEVLRLLKAEPLPLVDLVRKLDRTKSLIFRVLRELESREFVTRDGNGRYRLGIEAFEMGPAYIAQSSFDEVVRELLQGLADRSGETVNMGVMRGREVLYVFKYVRPGSYLTISRVGGRVPAHCVAIGKALLSQLTSAAVTKLFAGTHRLPTMTPNSIATVSDLVQELNRVRSQGYACDYEEAVLGRCGLAVPVHLRGEVDEIAALSLSAAKESFEERKDDLVALLVDCKERISRDNQARTELARFEPERT